jgi:protein Mpv17
MLIDQTFFAPFIIASFFTFTTALEGKSPSQIHDKLKENFLPSLKANYFLWPAAQLINFTFVPTHLAVLYVSGVSVVWNTWLCYTSSKGKH